MNTNLDMLRQMIANGHAKEAAKWLELVSQVLPAEDLRAVQSLLTTAILSPVKRKQGDKYGDGDGFIVIAREFAFARAVSERVEAGESIEAATGAIAEKGISDPAKAGKRLYKGADTVKRLYRKWIKDTS